MITAIVMVNCEVELIPEVAQAIADIPGVREVHSVTGEIDLIARVKVTAYEDVEGVVTSGIAKVPGVKSLTTHLAFRAYSRSDLEEAFELGLD